MTFLIDSKSISFALSILFVVLAFIFGLKKHKGFNLQIFFYMASAYILGSAVYSSFSLMYYSFQNNTIFGESIIEYRTEIGLAGVIVFLLSILGMWTMLKIESSKGIIKINTEPLNISNK